MTDESIDLGHWSEEQVKERTEDISAMDLMYSKELEEDTSKNETGTEVKSELSESFLDLEGSPIRTKNLIYTPSEHKVIKFNSKPVSGNHGLFSPKPNHLGNGKLFMKKKKKPKHLT